MEYLGSFILFLFVKGTHIHLLLHRCKNNLLISISANFYMITQICGNIFILSIFIFVLLVFISMEFSSLLLIMAIIFIMVKLVSWNFTLVCCCCIFILPPFSTYSSPPSKIIFLHGCTSLLFILSYYHKI